MKNLKISQKLLVSFSIVVALALIIGIVSIIGLGKLDKDYTGLYERNVASIMKLNYILTNVTNQRALNRDIILTSIDSRYGATVDEAIALLRDSEKQMKDMLNDYEAWAKNAAAKEALQEFRVIYEEEFKNGKERLIESAKNGNIAGARSELSQLALIYVDMSRALNDVITLSDNLAAEVSENCTNLAGLLRMIQLLLIIAAFGVSALVTWYVASIIAKPLGRIKNIIDETGTTGNLIFTDEVINAVKADAQYKDEIGVMAGSFAKMMDRLIDISYQLDKISSGDLTVLVTPLTDKDALGNSLKKMVDNLSTMFGDINSCANEVSNESVQVSEGAQTLAQDTTEQAASVEELTASVAGINEMAENIKTEARKGNAHMQEMLKAVQEINVSSDEIAKVIKVIDDIAFQTNILALNAAVEAAHAGQHGKGFAVVAEEVRNLASKSAEAARSTTAEIEDSTQKARYGVKIANETAEALSDIVFQVDEVANALGQINIGISQISESIQNNSATSEESAAASEELSEQANKLKTFVAMFKLRKVG